MRRATKGNLEMKIITAQVSLYPLGQQAIGPPVRDVVRAFQQRGLNARMDEMSTLVWGEEHAVFKGLQESFHRATAHGDTVMAVTISNACPEPAEQISPQSGKG
jgi:uncharacterized protein YqgV (UPF0045/DUF77 family)